MAYKDIDRADFENIVPLKGIDSLRERDSLYNTNDNHSGQLISNLILIAVFGCRYEEVGKDHSQARLGNTRILTSSSLENAFN